MKKTLRSELMSQDPELYSALEHSTEIAKTQWLPNVPQNKDSYNSYPHLISIEHHLDDILYRNNPPTNIIKLNPTEIYVLLCAVLFHDIGRAIKTSSGVKEEHAFYSQETIKKSWAQLGIPSEHLANIIGHICRFHDCNNPTAKKMLEQIYYVDRYDPIRGRKLGALLMLADKVDNTFFRVVPDYLFENSSLMEVVGAYRNKIQAVQVDYETQMVRTIINSDYLVSKDFWDDKVYGKLPDYLRTRKEPYAGPINEKSTLYIIAENVYSSNEALKEIRNDLYAMHIPLKKWMIECDNRLYRVESLNKNNVTKYNIPEAIEPIISYDYCYNVLRGIIRLSGNSFGKTFHTYEKLLRYVKEDIENINKIRSTVKRLAVLLDYTEDNLNNIGIKIYHDEEGWQITGLIISGKKKTGVWMKENDVEYICKRLNNILLEKVGKGNAEAE